MALRKLAIAQMRTAARSGFARRLMSRGTDHKATFSVASTVVGSTSMQHVAGGLSGTLTAKFGDPSFWEGEYASQYACQEELQPFEWFLPYEGGLRQHLLPFLQAMPSCNRLLHVGCGTSEVGPKLAGEPGLMDVHVTDTDSSPSAVRIMKRRHGDLENYACLKADAMNLPFPDKSFDAVVDKGTLDALLCRSEADAQSMAAEAHRVLIKGGVFLQVTTEGPEARLDLLTKRAGRVHGEWSRTLFKEIGEGANSTYFMYVLVK